MAAEAPPNTWQVADTVLRDPGRRGRLVAFAWCRYGIGAADAEDLLQDTALELLRHRASVQKPEGFVFTVFRSLCARFAASRRRRPEQTGLTGLFEAMPAGATPEKADRQLALRQALAEISSACRRILAAYYVEGRSLGEAAHSAELAASGARKTISRCLKRLRACLI
jgi:RNA polymerase sigma factor (sigma-70 family)